MENIKSRKRVLMLCGDSMEDFEAMVPFQALQAYGVEVDAVSPGKKAGDSCRMIKYTSYDGKRFSDTIPDWLETYREIPGHNFILNADFDKIHAAEYDGLVIPGARGPEYLTKYESVREMVRHFTSSKIKKPIAAICHAILLLAAADPESLSGRRCTGFPTMRPVAIAAGAQWIEPLTVDKVVVDGNLITAVIPVGLVQFIGSFVKALGGVIKGPTKPPQILMLCGNFMEEYDGYVLSQSLEVLGCHVDAVCPNKKKGDVCPTVVWEYEKGNTNFSEKYGRDYELTACFDRIDHSSYDALLIPGGRASEFYALDGKTLSLVKDFMKRNIPVGAIGFAPLILAAADVLQKRKCTAHPCAKVNVDMAKAIWQETPENSCYIDVNLITGVWWHGHHQLISHLMKLLGLHVSFE